MSRHDWDGHASSGWILVIILSDCRVCPDAALKTVIGRAASGVRVSERAERKSGPQILRRSVPPTSNDRGDTGGYGVAAPQVGAELHDTYWKHSAVRCRTRVMNAFRSPGGRCHTIAGTSNLPICVTIVATTCHASTAANFREPFVQGNGVQNVRPSLLSSHSTCSVRVGAGHLLHQRRAHNVRLPRSSHLCLLLLRESAPHDRHDPRVPLVQERRHVPLEQAELELRNTLQNFTSKTRRIPAQSCAHADAELCACGCVSAVESGFLRVRRHRAVWLMAMTSTRRPREHEQRCHANTHRDVSEHKRALLDRRLSLEPCHEHVQFRFQLQHRAVCTCQY